MSSNASKKWSGTIKELEQKRDKIKRLIKHHIDEDKKLSKNEPLEEAKITRAKQAAETLASAHNKISAINSERDLSLRDLVKLINQAS